MIDSVAREKLILSSSVPCKTRETAEELLKMWKEENAEDKGFKTKYWIEKVENEDAIGSFSYPYTAKRHLEREIKKNRV